MRRSLTLKGQHGSRESGSNESNTGGTANPDVVATSLVTLHACFNEKLIIQKIHAHKN